MVTSNFNHDRGIAFLANMYRIRAFEEQAILAAERDKLVLGAIHPSIGQEAAAIGLMWSLRNDDYLLTTHRGHGHMIAKGADPTAMMREILGRKGGSCGGKGGSMHIADFGVPRWVLVPQGPRATSTVFVLPNKMPPPDIKR